MSQIVRDEGLLVVGQREKSESDTQICILGDFDNEHPRDCRRK